MPIPDAPNRPPRRVAPLWQSAIVLALMALSALEMLAMLHAGAVHGNDFKHLWAGSWLLAHGLDPYDPRLLFKLAQSHGLGAINPYVYLPTTGLLLWPLAQLPYRAAMLLWFALNWLLAWGCVLWGPWLLRLPRPGLARLAGATFIAAAFPFFRQMTAGQMNVVMAALLLWGAAALIRRRDRQFGIAIGLGIAWKIAPIVLIGALLAFRRRQALAWCLATCLILVCLSFPFADAAIWRNGLNTIGQMGYGQSTWSGLGMDFYRDPFNQSINALAHHLLTANPHSTPWLSASPAWADRLTLALALGLCLAWGARALIIFRRPDAVEHAQDFYWATALLMLLLPSLLWDHYAVQALPILMFLFGHGHLTGRPRGMLGALAILLLLAVPWVHQSPAWREGAGILLMSLRLWPLLGLYAWLLATTGSPASRASSAR